MKKDMSVLVGDVGEADAGGERRRKALDHDSPGGNLEGNWPGYVPPMPHPDIPYTGTPNPGIDSSRPIARSNPDLGECDLDEGCAFRIPMGDQSDPYSG